MRYSDEYVAELKEEYKDAVNEIAVWEGELAKHRDKIAELEAKIAELEEQVKVHQYHAKTWKAKYKTKGADAIREMVEFALDCCPPDYSSDSIPLQLIEDYADNLISNSISK